MFGFFRVVVLRVHTAQGIRRSIGSPSMQGTYGAVLKQLGRAEFEKWMETPSNPDAPPESRQYHWQLWESNKMQASEKRILMTWVFGRAWEQLLTPRCVQPQKS